MFSAICRNKNCDNELTEYQAKIAELQFCRSCRSFDGIFVASKHFEPVRHLCVRIDTSRAIRRYYMRCPSPSCKTVRSMAVLTNANQPCGKCSWKAKRQPFLANYKRLVKSAKQREYAIDFSYAYFLRLCECRYCFYCNGKLRRFAQITAANPGAASCIDRIDSRAGYVLGNLASCCDTCNKEKREYLTGRQYAVYRALRANDTKTARKYLKLSDRQFAAAARAFFIRR